MKVDTQEKKQRIEHQVMQHSLKSGKIIAGLEGARFEDYYFWAQNLRKPIPIHVHKRMYTKSDQYKFGQDLKQMKEGTQVVIACLGLDGASCNEAGWREFIDLYQTARGLDLYMAISEDHLQWQGCKIGWSKDDWSGPFSHRYWTCFKLTELFEDVRLCRQLCEQWIKCKDGRAKISQGNLLQDRPARGRNGPSVKRNSVEKRISRK